MRTLPIAAALLAAACGSSAGGAAPEQAACTIARPLTPLPLSLAETSGAAAGPAGSGLVWTHTDSGGDAAVFAVSPDGRLAATVPITGAENVDWEDIAAGPCPDGRCLFLGDTGDNEAKRDETAIYRIPEPDPAHPVPARAERFRIRYPGGPRDAESLFVLPSGELFVMTKGRTGPLELYRYPGELRTGEVVELERVASLSPGRLTLPEQVTGADASPDGRWIAVRSYRGVRIYPAALARGDTTGARTIDLGPLDEPQGEGVAWLDATRIALTSEGVGKDEPGMIAVLECGGI